MANSSKSSDSGGLWNTQGHAEQSLRLDQQRIDLEASNSLARNTCDWPVSRRNFVKGAGIAVGASVFLPGLHSSESIAEEAPSAQQISLSITINGERKELKVDARTSLLDLLRENLGLTGTKKGCDHGQCD